MVLTVLCAHGADAQTDRNLGGSKAVVHGTVDLETVASGGVAIAASDFNTALVAAGFDAVASSIDTITLGDSDDASNTYVAAFDGTNSKIIPYTRADDAAATGDLSGNDFPFCAVLTRL